MKCVRDSKEINAPDFLVVGTGKAGTTSLHYYLKEHPNVVLPSNTKETLFFHMASNPNKAQLIFNHNAITDPDVYFAQFSHAKEGQICGEICPSYMFYYKHTIHNIKKYHPNWKNLKIIFILREPVSKVVSQYNFVKNNLKAQNVSLKKALALEKQYKDTDNVLGDLLYVDSTMYYQQVKAFMDNFEHVKVFFYENLKKDVHSFLAQILEYLEVEPFKLKPDKIAIYNKTVQTMKPKNGMVGNVYSGIKKLIPTAIKYRLPFIKNMIEKGLYEKEVDLEVQKQLKELFRPEVKKLQKLLDTDISFWGY